MKKMKMRVEAGFSYSNSGPREDRTRFRVRVLDDTSGQYLIEFYLDPTQFMDFMSNNGSLDVEADVTEFFHRIGKKMVHDTTTFRYGHNSGNIDAEAEEARLLYLASGWEMATINRHNYGLSVTARKWVKDEDQAE